MMEKIRNIMKRRNREEGAADLIVTLATIPFAIFLILALLDISLFLNTKSYVHSAARDGVRQAAMWGGSGAPGSGEKQVRLNTSGQATAANIKDKLWDASIKACTQSHCKHPPTVGCDRPVASQAGQKITCTVVYHYQSIVPGANLLGFGNITNNSFTVVEYSLSETGYR